jgi:hypothetical protein
VSLKKAARRAGTSVVLLKRSHPLADRLLIYANLLLRAFYAGPELLDLEIGGAYLLLRGGDLRLHFIGLQVERADGALERLLTAFILLDLTLILGYLRIQPPNLYVVGVYLRLEG